MFVYEDKYDEVKLKEKLFDVVLVKLQSLEIEGSVIVEGKCVDYKVMVGMLVLYGLGDKEYELMVSMFYIVYFKKGVFVGQWLIIFIYNGGFGLVMVWLYMGVFGLKCVVISDDSYMFVVFYGLVNNDYSLFDVFDFVFIDVFGVGFSCFIVDDLDKDKCDEQMKDCKKVIYGVDGDGYVFVQFIIQFLFKYGCWNLFKYLFGESYGIMCLVVVVNILENEDSVDFNGVVLLLQIFSFDISIDGFEFNFGVDLFYVLVLFIFVVIVYYYYQLLQLFVVLGLFFKEVEQYVMGDYVQVLMQGVVFDVMCKQVVVEKLYQYIGLLVDYLFKVDLCVIGGMFEYELQVFIDIIIGCFDSCFVGFLLDLFSKVSEYDLQFLVISLVYVVVFNDYVCKQFKFGQDMCYCLFVDIDYWDFVYKVLGVDGEVLQFFINVMLDLVMVMKINLDLKVFFNGGYYDLVMLYFVVEYEMNYLLIFDSLCKNIFIQWYLFGYMVYVYQDLLKQLYDNVVKFIQSIDNVK